MEDQSQKRKKRVQTMAKLGRKYKAFRYFLIALLAVIIFCDHLVHNTSRRFKVSVALVLVAALTAGLLMHGGVVIKESSSTGSMENVASGMTVSPVEHMLSCSMDGSQVITKFQLPVMNSHGATPSDDCVQEAPLVSETLLSVNDILPEDILTAVYETSPVEEEETINIEETDADEVVSSQDGEETSLPVSVNVLTEPVDVSSDSVSEGDILRVGYESAPEIEIAIKNEGEDTLQGIRAESELFEMVSENGIENLEAGESDTLLVRLTAGQEPGIYTEELRIDTEDESLGDAFVTVTQEVRRELVPLTISAPNLEIEVGADIPVIQVEDYLAEGLRDEDTVSMIDGIRKSVYDMENSDETGEAESELLTDLRLPDYEIEFHPGTLTVIPRIPDESYYQVTGPKNENQVYCGDMLISANGVDGFELVRAGEESEFAPSLTVSADAVEQGIDLYFAKGNAVSEKTVFTYTKDTTAPEIMTISSNNQIEGKIQCLTSSENGIAVRTLDEYIDISGNRLPGTGIHQLKSRYQDTDFDTQMKENQALISLPEDFYGQVEMYGRDLGGNESNHLEGLYLREKTAPTVSFDDLGTDRILVTVKETGPIVSGIADCVCMKNKEVYTPQQITVKEQTVLLEDVTVMTEYTFEVPVVNKDELAVAVRDYADNTAAEVYSYRKKVVNIVYPTDLNFAIDSKGITSMGQILSGDKELINYSNVPVDVEIKDLYCTFTDPAMCEALEQPVQNAKSEKKKQAYLYWSRAKLLSDNSCADGYRREYKEYTKESQKLPWGQQVLVGESVAGKDDIIITDQHLQKPITIHLEASEYSEEGQFIRLTPGSLASFRFFGSISENPDQEWVDQNITVHVVYTMHVSEVVAEDTPEK